MLFGVKIEISASDYVQQVYKHVNIYIESLFSEEGNSGIKGMETNIIMV